MVLNFSTDEATFKLKDAGAEKMVGASTILSNYPGSANTTAEEEIKLKGYEGLVFIK